MQPGNDILNELKEISPTLAEIPRVNPFSVPEGYFEGLAGSILLELMPPATTETGGVPEGYFEELPLQIMSRIRQMEVHDTPEAGNIISRIDKRNVFSVPVGYFDELPTRIMSKINQPARVVGFSRSMSFFRYAVAACLAGLLGLSLFSALNNADEGGYSPVIVAEAKQILQTNSFDQVMNTVTDEEITGYLQSAGQDVDAALLASITDASALPEAEDYIFDEQALERVLSQVGGNTNNRN